MHNFISIVFQAKKDAKMKERAKELKLLRKAREKKAKVFLTFYHYLSSNNKCDNFKSL